MASLDTPPTSTKAVVTTPDAVHPAVAGESGNVGTTTDNTNATAAATDSSHQSLLSDLWNTTTTGVKAAFNAMEHPVQTVENAYNAVEGGAADVLTNIGLGYDPGDKGAKAAKVAAAQGDNGASYMNQVFGGDLSNIFTEVNATTAANSHNDSTIAKSTDAQGRPIVSDTSADGSKKYTDGPNGQTYKDAKTGADVTYNKGEKSAVERNIAGTGITEQELPNGNWKTLPDGRQVFTSNGNSTDFDKTQVKAGKLYVFKDGVVMTRKDGDVYSYHENGQSEIDTPQGQIQLKDGKVTFNGQTVSDENLQAIQQMLQSDQLIKKDPTSGRIIIDHNEPQGMHIDNGRPDQVHVHIDNATTKGEGADVTAKPQDTTATGQPASTVTFDIPNEFRTVSSFPQGGSGQPQEQAVDLRPDHQVNGQPPQLFDYNYSNGDLAVGGDPNGLNPDITFTPSQTDIGWDGTTVDPDTGAFTDSDGTPVTPQLAAQDATDINSDATQAANIATNAVAAVTQLGDVGAGQAAIDQLEAAKSQIESDSAAPSYVIDGATNAIDQKEAMVYAALQNDQNRPDAKGPLSVVAFNSSNVDLNRPARFDDRPGTVSISTTDPNAAAA
jgi:hypothetical protein